MREMEDLRKRVNRFACRALLSDDPDIISQREDAMWFWEITGRAPYSSCNTVRELIRVISEERKNLKKETEALEEKIYGRQLTILDDNDEEFRCYGQNEYLMELLSVKKKNVRMLHKALGMCINPNYFDFKKLKLLEGK